MLLILLFLNILLINNLNASSYVEISSENQTDFQESAFIKLMANVNNGKIPYPFEELLASLRLGSKTETNNILLIPDGRSLVKHHADYKNPRIIVDPLSNVQVQDNKVELSKRKALMKKLNLREGDLFIGFAPNHKALEVISFNSKTRNYDFFIIADYEENKVPKIVSSPQQCLSCHQNGAPIFSRFPWMESSGKTGQEALDRSFNRFYDQVELLEKIKLANPNRTIIEGIDLNDKKNFRFLNVASFDSKAHLGNAYKRREFSCNLICPKGDKSCLTQNLLTGLDYKLKSNKNENVFKRKFSEIESEIRKFKLSSSAIPNRDPYSNTGFQAIIDEESSKLFELPIGTDLTFHEFGAINLGAKELSRSRNDFAFFDPATVRPMDSDWSEVITKINNSKTENEKMFSIVSTCFNMNSIEDIYKEVGAEEFKKLILSPKIQKFLGNYLNSNITDLREELINLKNEESESIDQTIDLTCLGNNKKTMTVFQFNEVKETIKVVRDNLIERPMGLFKKYCIECHGEHGFIKLPLNSPEMLADYSPEFGDTDILYRLENNIMPPASTPNQPSKEEREELIKFIKELKK